MRALGTHLSLGLLLAASMLGGCKAKRAQQPLITGWAPPPPMLLPIAPPAPPLPPPAPFDPSPLRVALDGACVATGVSTVGTSTYAHVRAQGVADARALRFEGGNFDPAASGYATQVVGTTPTTSAFVLVGATATDRYVGRLEGQGLRVVGSFGACRPDARGVLGFSCEGPHPAHLEAFPWIGGSVLALGHFGTSYAKVLHGNAAVPDMKLSAPVVRGEFHSGASVTATPKGLAAYAELVTWQVPKTRPDAPPDIRTRGLWIETWSAARGVVSTWKQVPLKLLSSPRTAPGPDGVVLVFVPGTSKVTVFDGGDLRSGPDLPIPAHEIGDVVTTSGGDVWMLSGRPVLGEGPKPGAPRLFRWAKGQGKVDEVALPDDARAAQGEGARLAVVRGEPWLRGARGVYRRENGAFVEVPLPLTIAGGTPRWVGGVDEAWVGVAAADGKRDALVTTAPVLGTRSCSELDGLAQARWVR